MAGIAIVTIGTDYSAAVDTEDPVLAQHGLEDQISDPAADTLGGDVVGRCRHGLPVPRAGSSPSEAKNPLGS